ncbi:MAG: HAD family phosphatase [Bacteroidetes bacterium]|nr:HAD family phosphatase [Bacteroidota bacterium]
MNMLSGKRALLLDFDGTLGDTFSLHEQAFLKTLAPYPIPFAYKDYIGQSTGEVFEHLFKKAKQDFAPGELAALVAAKRKAANDLYASHLKFIEGAEAFVHQAHFLGYRLAVGSSGSRKNILAGIEGLGLAPFISEVITADDVQYGKPHPEIFETLLHRLQVPAAEALVVEDAPSGLAAALAAGIEVVCIDPELRDSDYGKHPSVHFATFAQLSEALVPPVSTE